MKETLFVGTDDRNFDHGVITKEVKGLETKVEIEAHLVVSSGDYPNFKRELEKLLKEYAI